MTEPHLIRRPSAWLPIAMSLTALGIVALHLARYGVTRDTDEGTSAHLWQILMGVQVFIVGFFAITWLPQRPRQALLILALQAACALAAMAPVFLLEL